MKNLLNSLSDLSVSHPMGRVAGVSDGVIHVTGLSVQVRVGDSLRIRRKTGSVLQGEILGMRPDFVRMLPTRPPNNVAIGDPVILSRPPVFAPSDDWLGRVIDPNGEPLDGLPLAQGDDAKDILAPPPVAAGRKALGQRMHTGLAVMNTILPVVQGQRIGLFAGSGVGKTRLLAQLAGNMQAEVVVIAMIGERGREVNEFVANVLGEDGMKRAVVVAATSDQSALTRRRCAWAAMAVAEHFRDQGKSVLLLADSITRFAEAHREVALASGESPSLRGHPPSIASMIASLCERAGPGRHGAGDITAVFSVLVAGSDMEEPIADMLRGVLDGHIVLSRDIAQRGRFPAIDVGKSISRSLPDAASDRENALVTEVRKLLGAYENAQIMINAGLYTKGSDPDLDKAVALWPELDNFFSRFEPGNVSDSFDKLALLMRKAESAGRNT